MVRGGAAVVGPVHPGLRELAADPEELGILCVDIYPLPEHRLQIMVISFPDNDLKVCAVKVHVEEYIPRIWDKDLPLCVKYANRPKWRNA